MVKKNSAAASNRFAPRNRDNDQEAATLGETFRKDKPEKRVQLTFAVDQSFRDRLASAARAMGETQRDLVVEAVEALLKKNADIITKYYKDQAATAAKYLADLDGQ